MQNRVAKILKWIPFVPVCNVGLVKTLVFYKNWNNISRFSSRKCLLNDGKYGYDGMTSNCLYCFGASDNLIPN